MSKPKILEQIENAGGVFVATKDITTYQEIQDAYDSGKDIIVPYNGAIYELITIPTGSNALVFQKRQFNNNGKATTCFYFMSLNSTNLWDGVFSSTPGQIANSIYRNGETTITSSTGYYRPILISTNEPAASDGNIGDIWIQYDAD